MHITRIYIEGFKRFTKFGLELNKSLNVIVGDNETGKSTVLEAIGLVLTGQYDGRLIEYTIDPYLFNAATVTDFFQKHLCGEQAKPPKIEIEAYFHDDLNDPDLARLKGTANTRNENCPGLVLTIEVVSDHVEAMKEYASDDSNPVVLPVEFYKAIWRSFANSRVTLKKLPFRVATIDTSLARIYRGPNRYVTQVVNDVLSEEQRRQLSLAYKKLRHEFTKEPGVTAINDHLKQQGNPATTKDLTVQMDMSSRSSWDRAITAHLDDLPFDCAGKGEQCRVQMRLAIAGAQKSRVLLIEEPENHLSHSNLNMLMDDIQKDSGDRQVILTTHSAFVLNKLGIDKLRLLSHEGKVASLTELTPATTDYFMKLPGYDTLRLILAKRSILVEGPSDELIVQRAYKDKHGKLPLEDGVDVISVRSLAFKRFLEIAALLKLNVCVVTDNDGNIAALRKKYSEYLNGTHSTIKILYDDNVQYPTLEPQLLKANSLDKLNMIFGTTCEDEAALLSYMGHKDHKTDCALRIFESTETWAVPEYIERAIE
ncbi:MAG: AAA family ATPase [Pirellulaceae bacterium]|nr:AAA family ATPase [Pirellulaceae bacterium]